MTMYFFYPIQQSAQQIYHTALLLSPLSSTPYEIIRQGAVHDWTHVIDFRDAAPYWGALLTTISAGSRRPTAIATFAEKVAVACEDVVNIYDAVTFTLEQSFLTTQSTTRIQGSEDGSILYSTHSRSVAWWDIQTGGLIDTFHTRSEINDMVVSQTDGHIACCLSDGSVAFQNAHTKHEDGFRSDQPVVTIRWLSPTELAAATERCVYIIDIDSGSTSMAGATLDPVWGMFVSSSDELVLGISKLDTAGDQGFCSFSSIKRTKWSFWEFPPYTKAQPRTFCGRLASPVRVGEEILFITPPNGVQVFNITGCHWTGAPLLEKAKSLAVSLDNNLVVQTEDSVQIFEFKVLKDDTSKKGEQLSHMYPLGENHAVCLLIGRHLAVIELETLRRFRPDVDTPPVESLLAKPPTSAPGSCSRGLVAEYGVSRIVQDWRSGAPLPRWAEGTEEDALLGGSSPMGTRIVTLYGLPQRELRVKEAADGTALAKLHLEDHGSKRTGVAYDLTFDSETTFRLKVDGPGYHIEIPYDIIPSPSGHYPYTITQGKPVPLSQPRTTSPYTLDANCEWVLDRQSRKICWIPPEIMRRGSGGYFWAGASLVMLGSDGEVRKLTFKDPDC
jgi:hypothetical protein